jgi:hypothetical protein
MGAASFNGRREHPRIKSVIRTTKTSGESTALMTEKIHIESYLTPGVEDEDPRALFLHYFCNVDDAERERTHFHLYVR